MIEDPAAAQDVIEKMLNLKIKQRSRQDQGRDYDVVEENVKQIHKWNEIVDFKLKNGGLDLQNKITEA